MRRLWQQQDEIGAAARGQIIQRILVDGWTPAKAALSLGVDERRVRRWVADYRRHGMASLRGDLAAGTMWRRWARWRAGWRRWAGLLRARVARFRAATRCDLGAISPGRCVVLRHKSDEHHQNRAEARR